MRLAWITDIHLDHIGSRRRDRFFREIVETGADGVLVGGDIAVASTVTRELSRMERVVGRPVWFVLGNHDFYGGSIAHVRAQATRLSTQTQAVWLGATGPVNLTPRTALVGHDGWGDARLGNPGGSEAVLTDFFVIAELAGTCDTTAIDRSELAARLRRLGDEAAAHMTRVLPPALESHPHVVVLTHVPPFREACWYQGAITDDDWLPYFSCRAVGDVLLSEASRRPDRQITVLCGHTHSAGECRPCPNLRVVTGAAQYGDPAVQRPLLEV